MQFHVVNVHDNFAPLMIEGVIAVFDDGKCAASAAADATASTGKKWQPRPIKIDGDAWKARERERLTTGQYRLPLFVERDWFKAKLFEVADHFVHVSTEKPSMVSFTESAEHGQQDRQTRLRVGRYLERFFPELDPDVLRRECEEHVGAFVKDAVFFAETADEIEEVYTNGPHSCMAHPKEDFDSCGSGVHPTAVYAGPDLAVAYLKKSDSDDEIRASARCVVWPSKKIYCRVYGSSSLATKLESMGYTEGDASGARIRRIMSGTRPIMPYVDGAEYAFLDGEFIRLTDESDGADWTTQNTNGFAGEMEKCECCGGTLNGDSFTVHTNRYDTESWCQSCADEDTVYIEDYGTYHIESCTKINDDTWMPDWVIDLHYFKSDKSQEYYHDDDGVSVIILNGSIRTYETWAACEAEDDATMCEKSGEYYHSDDVVYLESRGEYWGRDVFERHGFECPDCEENFSLAERFVSLTSNTLKLEPGACLCVSCAEDRIEEARNLEDAINALRHPALAMALYANLCLPAPATTSSI